MIKMMALLFKKPGLTDEEFKSYWKGKGSRTNNLNKKVI